MPKKQSKFVKIGDNDFAQTLDLGLLKKVSRDNFNLNDVVAGQNDARIGELNSKLAKIENALDQLASKNDGLDKKLATKVQGFNETLNNKIKEFDTKVEAQNKKISSDKNRIIETLGVFVAIFTFVSGQIQIFKDQSNTRNTVATILITGGILAFFVLILDLMSKTRDEAGGLMRLRFFLLLVICTLMISSGILMTIIK